jgi:hypothetical protein
MRRALRATAALAVVAGALTVPGIASAAGTADGFVVLNADDGLCEFGSFQPVAVLQNADTTAHTYLVYGAFFERGARMSGGTQQVTLEPGDATEFSLYFGNFLAGHHGASLVYTVGLVDDNTREFRIRIPLTIERCGSAT